MLSFMKKNNKTKILILINLYLSIGLIIYFILIYIVKVNILIIC